MSRSQSERRNIFTESDREITHTHKIEIWIFPKFHIEIWTLSNHITIKAFKIVMSIIFEEKALNIERNNSENNTLIS